MHNKDVIPSEILPPARCTMPITTKVKPVTCDVSLSSTNLLRISEGSWLTRTYDFNSEPAERNVQYQCVCSLFKYTLSSKELAWDLGQSKLGSKENRNNEKCHHKSKWHLTLLRWASLSVRARTRTQKLLHLKTENVRDLLSGLIYHQSREGPLRIVLSYYLSQFLPLYRATRGLMALE